MIDDKRFTLVFAFAVFAFVSGITLLAGIIFGAIPKENQQMANVALGFIMNTLISTVLLYFFGGTPSKRTEPTTPTVTTNGDTTSVTVNPTPTPDETKV